jgi:hypothetical protein
MHYLKITLLLKIINLLQYIQYSLSWIIFLTFRLIISQIDFLCVPLINVLRNLRNDSLMNIIFVEEVINHSQIYNFSIWVYYVKELLFYLNIDGVWVCLKCSLIAEWQDHLLLITQISFQQNQRLLLQLLKNFRGLLSYLLFVDD